MIYVMFAVIVTGFAIAFEQWDSNCNRVSSAILGPEVVTSVDVCTQT